MDGGDSPEEDETDGESRFDRPIPAEPELRDDPADPVGEDVAGEQPKEDALENVDRGTWLVNKDKFGNCKGKACASGEVGRIGQGDPPQNYLVIYLDDTWGWVDRAKLRALTAQEQKNLADAQQEMAYLRGDFNPGGLPPFFENLLGDKAKFVKQYAWVGIIGFFVVTFLYRWLSSMCSKVVRKVTVNENSERKQQRDDVLAARERMQARMDKESNDSGYVPKVMKRNKEKEKFRNSSGYRLEGGTPPSPDNKPERKKPKGKKKGNFGRGNASYQERLGLARRQNAGGSTFSRGSSRYGGNDGG